MRGKKESGSSAKEIIRAGLKERGMSQKGLSEKIGMLQTSVSAGITREHIGLDLFNRIMGGMGYSIWIVDEESGEIKWKVRNDE